MSRLAFLGARAWLDEDGRHVWLAHDCVNGRDVTMLPTVWTADEYDRVSPSIDCRVEQGGCGAHFFAHIEPKPEFQ